MLEQSPILKYQPDDDYLRSKSKMESNNQHHGHCVASQKRKKSKSPPKKDIRVSFDNANEKLLILRDQNMHLKGRGRDLEDEVKHIATKLKRQITQLKRDKIVGQGGQVYSRIDEELDHMIEENFSLQEEERKLMTAVKKLQHKKQAGIATSSSKVKKLTKTIERSISPNPQRGQAPRHDVSGSAHEFLMDIQNMRANIEESNKKIADLRTDLEVNRRATTGQIPSEDLMYELRQKELKVAQARARLEDLLDTMKVKETIFNENQSYQSGLMEELKLINTDYLRLQKENRAYEEAAKQSDYLVKRIEEAREDKNKMQKEFDTITRQPFFKRESDQTAFKRISELQSKIEERDRGIKDTKENLIKTEDQIRQLNDEQRNTKIEREGYNEEIERLRMQLDPNAMSLADIQKKIHDLDPSMFRQVMKDLKYDGQEPIWAKFDFMERLKLGPSNQPIDENDPHQLKREIEKLKVERRDLATELEKVQNLLKMQVGIDKETSYIYQQEVEQIKSLITSDNRKITELNSLINARNQKLIAITKQTTSLQGHSQLTTEGLAKIDQDIMKLQRANREEDMLSEFSVITDESEVSPQENVMDLIVSRATFDRQRLSQIMGNKEILPSAVQTFMTVDFYNHDTRNSDLAEGFEPNYSTQFSFKNTIDDFYIQYLEKNILTVDIFITRAQNAIKIGSAKIVLSKVIEKDHTFQAQEIFHEGGVGSSELGGGYSIGKIFYKMRMRKSIDEAIKWYQQKRALRITRDPASMALGQSGVNGGVPTKGRSKVITIQVLRCLDLKRPEQAVTKNSRPKEMQPFFHFQFFTFDDYTSQVMSGNNAHFDIRKQYEVEVTDQLVEYMRTQVLHIHLIDESVNIMDAGVEGRDYIGSARVPMKDLLIGSGAGVEEVADCFPVKDENGNENGRLEVRISCRDYQGYGGGMDDPQKRAGDTFIVSKFAEREIIGKIAEKFADSVMESIDMIFDMLIEPGSHDSHRISKRRFKEYVLTITDSIKDQDVEILLKTNSVIQGKDFIDLNDFRNMFEIPVSQAKQRKIELIAEREKTYNQAQKFFNSNNQNMHTVTRGPSDLSLKISSTNTGYGQPLEQATMTFTKNPFLDQSINQRESETPAFSQMKKINIPGSTPAFQTQKTIQSFGEFMKENLYKIINKFKEVTKGQAAANWEQFRSTMAELLKGTGHTEQDIGQFWAGNNINEQFFYSEQLLQMFNQGSGQVRQDTLQYKRYMQSQSDPALVRIKEKLQQHLVKNDLSLEHLFSFIDKDHSQTLTIEEVTKGLSSIITSDEAVTLFMSIDTDNNKILTYDELITGLSKIHASYILYKLKQAIQVSAKSGLTVKQIFKTVDDNSNGEMDITEFNELVTLCFKELKKTEIDLLFQHFDKKGLGKLTIDEFEKELNQPLSLENKLSFTLHDFLTPLQTITKAQQISSNSIFDLFSGKDKKPFTIDKFKEIIRFYLKIELSEDEVTLLNSAILAFYGPKVQQGGHIVIEKSIFADLLSKSFKVKNLGGGNVALAKQTLTRVKVALKTKAQINHQAQQSLEIIMAPYLDEALPSGQQKIVNIRSLKVFLMVGTARGMTCTEIENLVDYLDKDQNGFIGVKDLDKELQYTL